MNYKIYTDDSLNRIKKLPDNSVDLIFTDPPYNLSPYSTGNMKFTWRKEINNDLAHWDKDFDPSEWLTEFKRILKPTGNILAFTSYNLIGRWHDAFDSEFDTFQYIVWHKTNPVPKFRKAGFLNSCEMIVACWNRGHKWNFGKQNEMHNFYEGPICMGTERVKNPVHPTQKPVKLLSHFIKIATNPGDVVFDPFMGVGSTGVATVQAGRKFIGIDIDEAYVKAAEKRLIEASNKISLLSEVPEEGIIPNEAGNFLELLDAA